MRLKPAFLGLAVPHKSKGLNGMWEGLLGSKADWHNVCSVPEFVLHKGKRGFFLPFTIKVLDLYITVHVNCLQKCIEAIHNHF